MDIKTRGTTSAISNDKKFIKSRDGLIAVGKIATRIGNNIKQRNENQDIRKNAEYAAGNDLANKGKMQVQGAQRMVSRGITRAINQNIINKMAIFKQTKGIKKLLASAGKGISKMLVAGGSSVIALILIVSLIISGMLSGGATGETTYGGFVSMPFDVNTVWFSVNSEYGYRSDPQYGYRAFHAGIDLGIPSNTQVLAAQTGTVMQTGYDGVRGNYVILQNPLACVDGGMIYTIYMHMNQVLVKQGDNVLMGQTIGLSGSTGKSTGPHLHFEVRDCYYQTVEPRIYLNYYD